MGIRELLRHDTQEEGQGRLRVELRFRFGVLRFRGLWDTQVELFARRSGAQKGARDEGVSGRRLATR